MYQFARPIARLIEDLTRLPGVGPKTAQRLAFHLLSTSRAEALSLAKAIVEARDKLRHCSVCCNITDVDPCLLCASDKRVSFRLFVLLKSRKTSGARANPGIPWPLPRAARCDIAD